MSPNVPKVPKVFGFSLEMAIVLSHKSRKGKVQKKKIEKKTNKC